MYRASTTLTRKNMINVIFLGKFFPQQMLRTVKQDSKGKIGMSNHNFEMSIINGLCQQNGVNFKCITCPAVYSYPYNNNQFYSNSESYDYNNTHIDSAGFCNLVGLKEIWSAHATAKLLVDVAESFKEETVHLIINTPNARLYDAVRIAERRTKKQFTKTIIIPDIPSLVQSMDKENPIKTILVNRSNRKVMEETSLADGLVLLTEAMMDFVSRPVKHIVMEGIVDVQTMDMLQVESVKDKQVILYTGTLRRVFGVMNLVEAFHNVPDKDVELWICGSGDSCRYIEDFALTDTRIKYFGLVDSKTALEMQHKATILVNPRTSEGEFTKYSFPSKTIEYLLAGKSVIINRLPGIPEEYFEYVYTPKDESIEAFTKCIIDVLHENPHKRESRALNGKKFVVSQKNSKIQMKRVLELIKSYKV